MVKGPVREGSLEVEVATALGLDSMTIVEFDSTSKSEDAGEAWATFWLLKRPPLRLQPLLFLEEAFQNQSGTKTLVVALLLQQAWLRPPPRWLDS